MQQTLVKQIDIVNKQINHQIKTVNKTILKPSINYSKGLLIDFKTEIIRQGILQMLNILPKLSDTNIDRFMGFISKLFRPIGNKKQRGAVAEAVGDGTSFKDLFKRLLRELNPVARKRLINNLVINWHILGPRLTPKFAYRERNNSLFFVISPTMTCNLRCKGCYAGEYTKKDDLPYDVIDRLFKEAKELGIYFIVVSGGEPFFRKDLLRLFEKHNDIYFLVYTNGWLINKALARKLGRLGNVAPAVSVEGFAKETDERRSKGVHRQVIEAMKHLKKEGVMFGFSATPTHYNSDIIATNRFIDYYIGQGCKFGWFFQYVPIGLKPAPGLMSTPEQRQKLREKVWKWRKTKPIFLGDFWNDGPLVGGCLAGGRKYFHINVHGDVEPCVFCHFAVDNIKKKSLKQVLNSSLFKAIRQVQPYSKDGNLLTPCMIIDNPKVMRKIVKRYKARPTHPGAETIVSDEKIASILDCYSKSLHKLTGKVWREHYEGFVRK